MLKSKKAFTIIELVIVIAVIAILAAVLIPTFSDIIKKANDSNDTVLLKNMNDAVTVYGVNKPVETATDVCIALKQAGLLKHLTPYNENRKFVWNVDSKMVEMVGSDEEGAFWISIDYPVPKEETATGEIDFKDLR